MIEPWYSSSKSNILGSFTDAEISKVQTQHYRRKNASFCVEVGDAPPYDIRLAFKNQLVVNSNKTIDAYQHRLNYGEKNIKRTTELCLHHLNESDSGIYKLSIVKNGKIVDKEFTLVVQGECFQCVLSNDRIL